MIKIIFRTSILVVGVAAILLLLSFPDQVPLPVKNNNSILRIGTANLYYNNEFPEAASETLIKTDFDILLGLEWRGDNLDLKILQRNGYKVFLNKPEVGTHGLFIAGKKSWNLKTDLISSPVKGPCSMPIATARFNVNNQPVTLLGVHAPPPISVCKETTVPTIRKICSWVEGGVLNRNTGAGRKGDTVIIAGDLNTYPVHPVMNCFDKAGLKDIYASGEGSWRLAPTWSPTASLPAILRIDYIFSGLNIEIKSAYNFTVTGSDHRGVLGDLEIIVDN